MNRRSEVHGQLSKLDEEFREYRAKTELAIERLKSLIEELVEQQGHQGLRMSRLEEMLKGNEVKEEEIKKEEVEE